jgi:ABC-2 type transport system permease protein
MLRTARAFLSRDFLIAISYRSAFLIQILGILFSVTVFFYMGHAVGGASPLLRPYGGNYFAFLIVGMAFVDYLGNSLQTFATSIREGQLMGTLEMLLVTPVRPSVIILSSSLWSYLFSSLRAILMLAVSALFYDMPLGTANLSGALTVFLLSIVYLMGLGILLAGVVLIIKQAGVVTTLMIFTTVLVGGVAYPVDVLPAWLRAISGILPFTHSILGLRQALLLGYSWDRLLPEILILAGFGLFLLPLGLVTFSYCVKCVKTSGTLSHY